MSPGAVEIDAALAARLVAEQFPQWAELPVRSVTPGGWDNRTFHLGDRMLVRLPSAARYAAQVEKEHVWLPRLAPLLPLPIPIPLALAEPADEYPWRWSVRHWIEGESAASTGHTNLRQLAVDLARFLAALQRADPGGGPVAGEHNFYRGGPLATYDAETRAAIAGLRHQIDGGRAVGVWETALESAWSRGPVWIHGDLSAANLLMQDGQLSAVIDFGKLGIGDPACDLAIAWTLFTGASREAFRDALPLDDGTWERGRGWALWKALITLAEHGGATPAGAQSRQTLEQILSGA